jgi:hypothetical protein
MAMKTANDDVYFRIKSAGALKAAGIRLNNRDMEQEGREAYAAAYLENAILVYTEDLTDAARDALVRLLFEVPTHSTDADEDATADAEETAAEIEAEARALRKVRTPSDIVPARELPPETLYDPDNEVEDEEDDYVDITDDDEDDL